ncbi:serine/threonine-protein kinase LMTK1-like [Littorina saxatilis]|uniref:Protein kinase domain-containing protein n=1 Tax=Littorina saxatilis TaxID=31220 RepID=A0AAN9BVC4_9CAEN
MLQDASLPLSLTALVAVVFPVTLVAVLMVCMQCFRKKLSGFTNLGNSNSTNSINANQGHVNNTFSVEMDDTDVDVPNSTAVTIEPLPDISKAKLPTVPLRPRMGCLEKSRKDASLKMIAVHHPFPRNQITYLKELGSSWFGKVIESDADKIVTGVPRSKVVVKMLKDDATKDEQLLFFEEVAPFREIEHTNILRLLGQCTEINPMLMILESAAFGNLKHYLRSHRQQQAALIQKNRLIQFAIDASCGLACLHRHDYLHRDLAARNCLVMSDHTLKIGDYGIAEDLYKEDYFKCGRELLPVRWMAPETLTQENRTWLSSNFSKESDIWSLGVLLWEIAMMGERPYNMLTDEAVLQGVIVDKDLPLTKPDISMPNLDRLYEVMQFCWLDAPQRTKVDEVYGLLKLIASQTPEGGAAPKEGIAAFEQKWEHLMPNQRHMSVDSMDDRSRGSFSSVDSDLLAEELAQPDSLEDLTSEVESFAPQAPPRATRKKLSAPTITIPQAEGLAEEAPPATKKKAEDMEKRPKISVPEETKPKDTAPKPVRRAPPVPKAAEPKSPSASETEFTEFASHAAGEVPKEAPSVSETVPDVFSSPNTSGQAVQKTETDDGFDDFQFAVEDTQSQEQAKVEDIVVNTPKKPQPKPRKTSTSITKDEASPSSSSSFSAGDSSSSTFLTARTSSPGNFTDTYATASNSALVTEGSKTSFDQTADFSADFGDQPATMGDSSMSFEILETTAVPSPFSDFEKAADEPKNSQTANPFLSPATDSQTPDADVTSSSQKDDSFGEFTDASLIEGSGGELPEEHSEMTASGDAAFSNKPESSMTQDDFFSFGDESSITVSQTQSSETSSGIETSTPESKPTVAKEANPFASFGTDLSSMSSLDTASAAADAAKEPTFPSFTSEFSSLSSLDTNSSATPQADPQINPFALDQTTEPTKPDESSAQSTKPQEGSSSLNGFGDFSFDMLSSVPDVASIAPVTGTGQNDAEGATQGAQQTPDLFGDLNFSGPPTDNSAGNNQLADFVSQSSPDSGNQSGNQQSLTDLFGLGEPVSQDTTVSSQENSPESSKETSSVPEPSSALSDFDLLSGFSPAPTSVANVQSSGSNPFSMEGGLLQDFVGSPSTAAPTSSGSKVGNGVESCGASFSSEPESSTTSTDTDSTSNSDSSKDYICEEPWGDAGAGSSPPPASSPTSSVDSEEMALQLATEIYLSKGLKLARPYETSFLESIPEHPFPSEEDVAPTPSETSSVDVRFEDVFEWDDFMGEPLVGKERTSSEPDSPEEKFDDMPDWTLDLDSESLRSGSSLRSQRSSDDRNKGSGGSDNTSVSSVETPNARSSVSDSEVTLHGGPQTHRSYISDLIANRTKGLSLNTSVTPSIPARTQNQSKFYSLYEEDFDLESSDSQSEGSCSPPVPNSVSESQGLPSWGGVSTLHAEPRLPHPSRSEGGDDSASTNIQQESHEEVRVANGSGGPEKSPDSTFLDFSAFGSASAEATAESTGETTTSTGESTTAESKSTSEANGASSLIDF